jgi:hypothetical protein
MWEEQEISIALPHDGFMSCHQGQCNITSRKSVASKSKGVVLNHGDGLPRIPSPFVQLPPLMPHSGVLDWRSVTS